MWSRDRTTYLALLVISAAASAACRVSDKRAAGSSMEQPGQGGMATRPRSGTKTDAWTDQWRKRTFADKDPATLQAKFSQAAQKELSTPGADPSDVDAKASVLDRDPQKIFEFMRDKIALEPYAGVLRGPRGTLMAGAGNALDRALLSQALLKASGIESRIISGRLSDAQASTLLKRYLDGSALPNVLSDLVTPADDAALSAEAADLATQSGFSQKSVEELLQHMRAQNKAFWAKTDARSSTQFTFLVTELQKSASHRRIDRAQLSASLKDRLREHWWVELKEPSGTWSAFDPSFADGARGTTYGSGPAPVAEIPAEKYHRLDLSLVYRTAANGAAKDEVLLTDTVPSADALFSPLEFGIGPAALGTNMSALTGMGSKQLIDMLQKVKRFRPVLRTGLVAKSGRVFDLDGNTYDPADASTGAPGGTFFGDALGGGEEPSSPQFVELRVVLRFTGPGRAPASQSRTLVRAEDLMSPTFAPPILRWEMLLQPQWLSTDFVGFKALRQTTQLAEALTAASSDAPGAKVMPPSVSLRLMDLALLRQSAVAGMLTRKQGLEALVDEPMLTILGERLGELRVAEGQITRELHVDIVANSVRYVPKDDGSQPAAFDAALSQGVADCVLEDQYLRELLPNADNRSGTSLLEQAQADARPVTLAKAQDSASVSGSGLPETDIAWIHDNESPASVLVIATTANGAASWWSVGPGGNAILRGRGGEGQSMGEYEATKDAHGGITLLQVLEFGSTLMCVWEIAEADAEGRAEGQVSAKMVGNVALCLLGQAIGKWFALVEAHNFSWAMLGLEAMWHGIQLHEEYGGVDWSHGYYTH